MSVARVRRADSGGRVNLGVEAVRDLILRFAVDRDRGEVDAEARLGDLPAGEDQGAGHGGGPAHRVVAEAQEALPDPESGRRPSRHPPCPASGPDGAAALSSPDVAEQRVEASPFGASVRGEWSLPALGLGGIASAFLEPDPAVEWDAERIAAVRQALAALALPDA